MQSIGEVSKATGLPTKTIRFYEEAGVIKPNIRAENGYRQYSQDAVEVLILIKYARDLGLPLSEIKKLIKGCDNGSCQHSKSEVQQSIQSYLELLNQKLAQMNLLKQKLQLLHHALGEKSTDCQDGKYCCNLLYQLLQIKNQKGGE